jgi:hypothetical protein
MFLIKNKEIMYEIKNINRIDKIIDIHNEATQITLQL